MQAAELAVIKSALRFLLIPALFALCGCGRLPDRAELVFINGGEPELLDPALVTAQATGRVMYALYEGLCAFDAKGKAQPGVAERWDISEDGLRYTFHLRPTAVWANGDPVTADDFYFSWKRVLQPETGAEYAYQLHYIRGAKDFNEGKLKDFDQVGLKVIDRATLEVTLENPTPFFLDLCAFSTLLPVHRPTVERYSDWSSRPEHFMGNGAFTLRDWRSFDRVRLAKNPRYWDAANVAMKSVDILPAARAITAYNFYATGLADLIIDRNLAPTPLLGELTKRRDFHAAPFLGTYFMRFNVTRKPFDDVRVRRAFSLIVDKKYLCERITRAGETPATSFVPPGTGDGYTSPPGYERNTEEARKLLAAAGFPDGKGFPVVYYLYRSDQDLDQYLAVELQGMLRRELGVNVQLARQEWTVLLNSQSTLDYDFTRSTWLGDYNDPNTFLDMFVTGGGNNNTGWGKKPYDDLIAAAGREVNKEKRYDLFRQAEKLLVSEEAPICPLYYFVNVQFYDPDRLGGIEANLLDEHPIKTMYWKKR